MERLGGILGAVRGFGKHSSLVKCYVDLNCRYLSPGGTLGEGLMMAVVALDARMPLDSSDRPYTCPCPRSLCLRV